MKKIGLIVGCVLSMNAHSEFNCHREDFPVLYQKKDNKQLAFLDSGATSQKPNQVIDTISDTYRYASANIHRGDYALSLKSTELYEHARTTVADFINANTNEIVFTKGSSESINFLASTWGDKFLQAGDEIVLTEMEHNSNVLPWAQLAARKNLVIKLIEVTPDGRLDLESMARVITSKTKLVCCIHTSNAIGTTNPIEKVIAAAHAVGAKVLIDGAQSVPYEQVDIHALDADFLVFSGHKMLAPTGIGVLYIKKNIIDSVPAYQWGGGMAHKVQLPFEDTIYHLAPEGLEAGTPPIVQAVGLGAAIDYLKEKVFPQPVKEHLASL
ncbi:MAG TPA: aminotransferase class V-fold PLP-dependent enzyme, partial [Candidatus Babeliales bacterium]|nr:aminotransferase class V-fold PLP-dependent enzyme [Candidatus Babeliales bacterium]